MLPGGKGRPFRGRGRGRGGELRPGCGRRAPPECPAGSGVRGRRIWRTAAGAGDPGATESHLAGRQDGPGRQENAQQRRSPCATAAAGGQVRPGSPCAGPQLVDGVAVIASFES